MLIKKLRKSFGVQIENFEIQKCNTQLLRKIINLFEKYSLIIIKNQKINNEEQIQFSKIFGELEITKTGTLGSNSHLVNFNKFSRSWKRC